MNPVTVFYLSLSAAAVMVAALSHDRDRRNALCLSLLLAGACAASNMAWAAEHRWTYPALCAIVALVSAGAYRGARRRWTRQIVWLCGAEMMIHVSWAVGDKSPVINYCYDATLNAIFLAQLWTVTGPGRRGARLVCDRLAHRLRSGGGWRVVRLRHRLEPSARRGRGGGA